MLETDFIRYQLLLNTSGDYKNLEKPFLGNKKKPISTKYAISKDFIIEESLEVFAPVMALWVY